MKRCVWFACAVSAVLLAGCMGDQQDSAGREYVAAPVGLADRCPPADTQLSFPEGDLPTGAVGVRLCPGPAQLTYGGRLAVAPIQAPVDELISVDNEVGLDPVLRLVNAVNELPDLDAENTFCTAEGGSDLVFWFRYADGQARAVRYEDYGCRTVQVGKDSTPQDVTIPEQSSDGPRRLDGRRVIEVFAAALDAQRDMLAPPPPQPRPSCRETLRGPMSLTALPVTSIDLASATLCVDAGRLRAREAAVPGALVQRLNDEMLPGRPDRPAGCRSDEAPTYQAIDGYSTWGDRVRYVWGDCERVSVAVALRMPDEGQRGYLEPVSAPLSMSCRSVRS